ncbi:MAG: Ferric iron transporter, permease protein [Devosia sp.]|uniref:ABC transporter permease n=1 Tax=Devosia sp. TaxID=1871048 RepID=UPI002610D4BB|nr:iron ABC transporter permease [Devosia sp.]MDB5541331.1 Ferric iron transporter, permease protein [Devosia sp.]
MSLAMLSVGRTRRIPHLPMVVASVVVSLLCLVPLGFIVWVAIDSGWDTVRQMVFRPRVGELLVNTFLLELVTLPIAIVLSVALAWLTERSTLPLARLWSWLMVAPLAVPAFVHSYAWNGFASSLNGFWGAVLVSVLAYFPFLYLPVAAQLRRLDPTLEDTAASLGQPQLAIFLRVILPQLRLAICGGALLVGLHLLAEYGLFVQMRFDTFATAIVDQFQSVYNGPAANLLGGVLVLLFFLFLGIEGVARGSERYARVGSGAARAPNRWRVPGWSLLLPLIVALLSLGVPIYALGRWLVLGGVGIWRLESIGPALGQTLLLALAGAALTTIAAFPAAWLSVRAPGRLQRVLEACHYYVGALPGVIVALALVTLTVRVALPLYQTIATLLLAYLLMFLPRALVGLRASIAQAPVELERAAMSLGKPPLLAVLTTTMRLAAPGAAASAALVALGIANELTGTLMLAPNGTRTLATRFWAYTSELDFSSAAPYALLMIVLSLPLVALLRLEADRISRS